MQAIEIFGLHGWVEITDPEDLIQKYWKLGVFYEADLLRQIATLDLCGNVAIDCGAHRGNHTLFFAKILGLKVLAFEPEDNNYKALKDNISLNTGLQVTTYKAALMDKPGVMELHSYGDNSGMNKITYIETPYSYPVPCYTVDGIAEGQNVGLLKIDAEGMEQEVLTGALETIKRCKPVIAVETPNAGKLMRWLNRQVDNIYHVYRGPFAKTPTYLFIPRPYELSNL